MAEARKCFWQISLQAGVCVCVCVCVCTHARTRVCECVCVCVLFPFIGTWAKCPAAISWPSSIQTTVGACENDFGSNILCVTVYHKEFSHCWWFLFYEYLKIHVSHKSSDLLLSFQWKFFHKEMSSLLYNYALWGAIYSTVKIRQRSIPFDF